MVELTSVSASQIWKERVGAEHRDAKRHRSFMSTFTNPDKPHKEHDRPIPNLHYNGSCRLPQLDYLTPRSNGSRKLSRNMSVDDVKEDNENGT